MSNEVTEYLVSRGELLRADNLRPAEVNRLVDAEAYRALEAECERLLAERNGAVALLGQSVWQKISALEAERDTLSAQLEAIRAAGGEEVEVVVVVSMGGVEYGIGGAELGDIDIQPDMQKLCALQQAIVTGEDDTYVELIDKAQHQRTVAAMAAELERLNRESQNLSDQLGSCDRKRRDAMAELQAIKAQGTAAKLQWPEIVGLVNEVLGCEAHKFPCERGSIGHEMTGINFNSLARIIDRVQHRHALPPLAGQVSVPDELVKFLLGEGELEGCWFGDAKPEAPAVKFWWRKHLRALLATPSMEVKHGD